MTAVDSEQKPEAAGAAPEEAGPGPAGPQPGAEPAAPAAPAEPTADAAPDERGNVVVGIGVAVTLLGLLVLGFVAYLYWLSGLQEARAQTGMYANLRAELAAGLAPLGSASSGPIPPGSPVAILNISAIGVHNQVVVEGTTPENLTLGPGHLRSSALPGETGIAVLYGKRVTFGGPFAKIPELLPGEEIQVTTGQGTSTYVVKVVGDSRFRILIDPAPNQLILLTADSAFAPSHYVEVEATLTSTPRANPGGEAGHQPSRGGPGQRPHCAHTVSGLGHGAGARVGRRNVSLCPLVEMAGVSGHRPDRDSRHMELLREPRSATAQPVLTPEEDR